jgi:pyruvyltransferase
VKILNKIPLFYWSSIIFEHQPLENYGDILSKYIVEKISKKKIVWKFPKNTRWYHKDKRIYFGAGSIIMHVDKHSIVWGSGIISKKDNFKEALFLAVRGPRTYQRIIELGYKCSPKFGDPAILLPRYYNPIVKKDFGIGIIPHYIDYEMISSLYQYDEDIKIISLLNNDVEETTQQILRCKRIVSSSLHGVIVSHSYDIPCLWVQFSDKLFGDNVKFQDYFESVSMDSYIPKMIDKKLTLDNINELFDKFISLPGEGIIDKLRNGLLEVCPFKG